MGLRHLVRDADQPVLAGGRVGAAHDGQRVLLEDVDGAHRSGRRLPVGQLGFPPHPSGGRLSRSVVFTATCWILAFFCWLQVTGLALCKFIFALRTI